MSQDKLLILVAIVEVIISIPAILWGFRQKKAEDL